MHIKNDHTPAGGEHRLFVAFPLFALIATLSVWAGIGHTRADVTPDGDIAVSGDMQRVETLHGTARVDAGADTAVEEGVLRLYDGNITIASGELSYLHVGDMIASGFAGTFAVSAVNDVHTFSALTTPVLIARGDARMVVPAGMQWTSGPIEPAHEDSAAWQMARTPADIPAHFLREALPLASALEAEVYPAEQMRRQSAGLFSFGLFLQFLQFESAERRAQEYQSAALLSALERALADNDEPVYQTLLLTDGMEAALQSDRGREVLPSLLSRARTIGKEALILPYFTRTADAWLLAVFHPGLRDAALMLPVPDAIDREQMQNMLFLLPVSDTAGVSLEVLAAQRWRDAWNMFLESQQHPAAVLDQSMPAFRSILVRFEQKLLPERLGRYRDMIREFVQPHEALLSPESLAILAGISALDVRIIDQAPPAVQPAQAVEKEPFNAQELEEATRARLAAFGAMFTSSTSVSALAADRVAVRDVVFATAAGDTLLTFVYHPLSDEAGEILFDGNILPYTLPLDKYLAWVKGI